MWLEEWLKAASATVLLISHDREFLDAIAGRVLYIENRTIRAYSGNYSAFEQKRAEELALQQALSVRQARRVAQITEFVNRFRAQATKARQAQSRLKMLERMERIVPMYLPWCDAGKIRIPLSFHGSVLALWKDLASDSSRFTVSIALWETRVLTTRSASVLRPLIRSCS